MSQSLGPYILAFIPIFVAVDAIGNIPVFVSLIEGLSRKQKQKILLDSIITATLVAILFMFVGKGIFRLIGISIADFQIAGGMLLFILSVRLLLPGAKKEIALSGKDTDIGVFPLGTPLITGPAVLTTTLMMRDSFGIAPTFVSVILNMLICWLALARFDLIIKLVGTAGTRAFSKIMFILLAAIGVMMVRLGVTAAFLK